jgi:hypothetical protein
MDTARKIDVCGPLHAHVGALHARVDALEPCIHFAHLLLILLAQLQQQAEQLGRCLVLGRAVPVRARFGSAC